MLISRFQLELEDAKQRLEHESRILRDMVQAVMGPEDKPYNLAEALSKSLAFQLDRVKKHLDLVARTSTDYLSRRNLAVTYRLQVQVFVLTIVATLAAIATVLASWPQIHTFLQAISKR